MREWHNDGGFSLDAAVRIPAWDRAALERLLRYCARPPFALERLEAIDDTHLIDHSSKPRADGTTELQLTPLELINRIAALVPPPRVHRHRYHGVLAPNSPLRDQVTALIPKTATDRWEFLKIIVNTPRLKSLIERRVRRFQTSWSSLTLPL